MRFLLRFLVFFVAAFLFWLATTPICTPILTFCTEKIVKVFDTHDFTEGMISRGKTIALKYAPSPDGKPHFMNARNISFNTVFLLALIMAVPDVNYKLRLKILLLGFIVLFPVQVVRLTIYILNYYATHMQMDGAPIYHSLWRKILFYGDLTLTRLDSMLVPVIIWAGLYYYYKWHAVFQKRKAVPVAAS